MPFLYSWLRVVAGVLVLPVALGQVQQPLVETLAQAPMKHLLSAPWDKTYNSWRRSYGTSVCRQYKGTGHVESADEQWCQQCTETEEGQRSTWYFYAFDETEAGGCRLEQFRSTAEGSPEILAEGLKLLERRLSERYGRSKDPGPDLNELGSGSWSNVRTWQTPELQLLLYLDHEYQGILLTLLARHGHLVGFNAQTSVIQDIADRGPTRLFGTDLDTRLSGELQTSFSEAAALLSRTDNPDDEGGLRRTLPHLLEAAERLPRPDRAPLLLAADRLANRFGLLLAPPQPRREEQTVAGLRFLWSPFAGYWGYDHELLWRVWKEYSESDWGELAFVDLLNAGWDTSPYCAKGSDQFREVIPRGERFLRDRPRSPHRLDVLMAVAQAYETWWSLSQADTESEYAEPARYREGAEAALGKAIKAYEQIVRSTPNSPQAKYARWRLPRLRLGVDANQRSFYCIYD